MLATRSCLLDRLFQKNNNTEPKKVKILLENLGQPEKTPKTVEQQDSDIGILETDGPDNKHPDG
jgi:hypothetical protein